MRDRPCPVTLFEPLLHLNELHPVRALVNSRLVDSFLVDSSALVRLSYTHPPHVQVNLTMQTFATFCHGLASDPALADPGDVLTRENTICPHIGSWKLPEKTSLAWDARPVCAADLKRAMTKTKTLELELWIL